MRGIPQPISTPSNLRVNSMSSALPAQYHIFSTLTSNGTDSMNTSGQTSAVTFSYSSTNPVMLHRAIVQIVDKGMNVTDFGGISGGLANGMEVCVTDSDSTVLLDYTAGLPIKINSDWVRLAGVDVDRDSNTGAGDDGFSVRWTIAKSGVPLMLGSGQSFNFVVNDSLTALTQFHVIVQGHAT